MKSFFKILLTVSAAGSVMAQPWPGRRDRDRNRDEVYMSQDLNRVVREADRNGRPTQMDVLTLFNLTNSNTRVKSLVIIASGHDERGFDDRNGNRWGQDTLHVLVNNRIVLSRPMQDDLAAIQIPINMMAGWQDLRTLEVAVNGSVYVASIGLSILSNVVPGPGPGPQPQPEREEIIEERIASRLMPGPFNSDRTEALNEYNANCEMWKQETEARLGDRVRELTCGNPVNSASSGFRYESTGRVRFIVRGETEINTELVGGRLVPGPFNSDKVEAYNDYLNRCNALKAELAKNTSNKVLYFTCGAVNNVASSGFQYTSTMKLVLQKSRRDVEKRTEKIQGLHIPGPFNSDRAEALRDYEQRCQAWKDGIRRYNNERRVVLLSCGAIRNTASSGFRYESDATAYLVEEILN